MMNNQARTSWREKSFTPVNEQQTPPYTAFGQQRPPSVSHPQYGNTLSDDGSSDTSRRSPTPTRTKRDSEATRLEVSGFWRGHGHQHEVDNISSHQERVLVFDYGSQRRILDELPDPYYEVTFVPILSSSLRVPGSTAFEHGTVSPPDELVAFIHRSVTCDVDGGGNFKLSSEHRDALHAELGLKEPDWAGSAKAGLSERERKCLKELGVELNLSHDDRKVSYEASLNLRDRLAKLEWAFRQRALCRAKAQDQEADFAIMSVEDARNPSLLKSMPEGFDYHGHESLIFTPKPISDWEPIINSEMASRYPDYRNSNHSQSNTLPAESHHGNANVLGRTQEASSRCTSDNQIQSVAHPSYPRSPVSQMALYENEYGYYGTEVFSGKVDSKTVLSGSGSQFD